MTAVLGTIGICAPTSNVVVGAGVCESQGTKKTVCGSFVIGLVMVCIAVTETGTCCSGIHGVANDASSTINKLSNLCVLNINQKNKNKNKKKERIIKKWIIL